LLSRRTGNGGIYFEEFGRALETENFGKWKKRLRTKKNNTKNTRAKKGK
jgi:hypothetical protein